MYITEHYATGNQGYAYYQQASSEEYTVLAESVRNSNDSMTRPMKLMEVRRGVLSNELLLVVLLTLKLVKSFRLELNTRP